MWLSSHLFAIYIDSVTETISDSQIGCFAKSICMSILLNGGDILLIVPLVRALQ